VRAPRGGVNSIRAGAPHGVRCRRTIVRCPENTINFSGFFFKYLQEWKIFRNFAASISGLKCGSRQPVEMAGNNSTMKNTLGLC
jgi:hypothetical protein